MYKMKFGKDKPTGLEQAIKMSKSMMKGGAMGAASKGVMKVIGPQKVSPAIKGAIKGAMLGASLGAGAKAARSINDAIRKQNRY